jgi:hypothetical protein
MQRICVHLYIELDIISGIRKGRLRWSGHVARMPEDKNCLRTSQKEKGPLESQERDDWTTMKMI